jgi:hypothetical protein
MGTGFDVCTPFGHEDRKQYTNDLRCGSTRGRLRHTLWVREQPPAAPLSYDRMPQWDGAHADCVRDKARYRTLTGGLAGWEGMRGC